MLSWPGTMRIAALEGEAVALRAALAEAAARADRESARADALAAALDALARRLAAVEDRPSPDDRLERLERLERLAHDVASLGDRLDAIDERARHAGDTAERAVGGVERAEDRAGAVEGELAGLRVALERLEHRLRLHREEADVTVAALLARVERVDRAAHIPTTGDKES